MKYVQFTTSSFFTAHEKTLYSILAVHLDPTLVLTMPVPTIAILGGGPSGLSLARLLEVNGIDYIVYERDASPEVEIQGGSLDIHGKSGQLVLKEAGLFEEFKKYARWEDSKTIVQDKTGATLLVFGAPRRLTALRCARFFSSLSRRTRSSRIMLLAAWRRIPLEKLLSTSRTVIQQLGSSLLLALMVLGPKHDTW